MWSSSFGSEFDTGYFQPYHHGNNWSMAAFAVMASPEKPYLLDHFCLSIFTVSHTEKSE
jgi:hypothetical protein